MKIATTSDIHYRYDFKIPKCDLFVVAGDILGNGSYVQLIKFNSFLREQREQFDKCLVTPGNHDMIFEYDLKVAKETLSEATVLVDQLIEIDGKKIYMSPWTPAFLHWHWMLKDRVQAKEVWSRIPNGLDLLVTHGPPHGILDLTDGSYDGYPKHVGCPDLLHRLKSMDQPPSNHVFGHIHHSFGVEYTSLTTYYNVSLCDEKYKATRPIVEFEI